jgi:hypothetical protein
MHGDEPERKKALESPRRSWENNIKTDLWKTRREVRTGLM